jgi:hypothetical protein
MPECYLSDIVDAQVELMKLISQGVLYELHFNIKWWGFPITNDLNLDLFRRADYLIPGET